MAANLVKSGERVHGFDVVADLRATSASDGVQIVANAQACVENADVVITMLPAGEHVLSVWNEIVPHARQAPCSSIARPSTSTARGRRISSRRRAALARLMRRCPAASAAPRRQR